MALEEKQTKEKGFSDTWTFKVLVVVIALPIIWFFDGDRNNEPKGMSREDAVVYVGTMYNTDDFSEGLIERRENYVIVLESEEAGDYFDIVYDNDMDAFVFTPEDKSWHDTFTQGKVGDNTIRLEYNETMHVFRELGPFVHDTEQAGVVVMSPTKNDTLLLWMYNDTIVYNRADELVEKD